MSTPHMWLIPVCKMAVAGIDRGDPSFCRPNSVVSPRALAKMCFLGVLSPGEMHVEAFESPSLRHFEMVIETRAETPRQFCG